MKKGKIYVSVLQVEVLSNEPIDLENYSLEHIADEVRSGEWSGQTKIISKNSEHTGKHAVNKIQSQSSDPEFFGLDMDGNELE